MAGFQKKGIPHGLLLLFTQHNTYDPLASAFGRRCAYLRSAHLSLPPPATKPICIFALTCRVAEQDIEKEEKHEEEHKVRAQRDRVDCLAPIWIRLSLFAGTAKRSLNGGRSP